MYNAKFFAGFILVIFFVLSLSSGKSTDQNRNPFPPARSGTAIIMTGAACEIPSAIPFKRKIKALLYETQYPSVA
jgi:hypothetical protein